MFIYFFYKYWCQTDKVGHTTIHLKYQLTKMRADGSQWFILKKLNQNQNIETNPDNSSYQFILWEKAEQKKEKG